MSIIDKLKNPPKDIRGFDGMLMIFTIALGATAIGYLISMFQSYLPYFQQTGFHFSTQGAQAYDVFRTYEFFGYAVIVLILIALTILLVTEKSIVVKLTNVLIPLSIFILISSYFIGAKITATPYALSFFLRLLQSLLIPVLFLIYMNKSLRVRNTFIDNTEIDYVKLAKDFKQKQKKSKPGILDRAKKYNNRPKK